MASTTQQLFEQTLVLRSQLGDERAFEKLLSIHGPRLFLFATKMMQGSPDVVEDLLQEIWLAIYQGLPGLRDVTRFRPWAVRIARDRIYREYRRRRPAARPLDNEVADLLATENAAESDVDVEELRYGLHAISPQHREVLVLCYFDEMSYAEIAEATGASLGTVRSRIHSRVKSASCMAAGGKDRENNYGLLVTRK
jgi:RNA polymerase sigma-70 factor (ECF subfamily)